MILPVIPLNFPKLMMALKDAPWESGTERMSVFVIVPHRDGTIDHRQVTQVEVAKFVDPGEVNWSVYLTLTEEKDD